MITNRIKILDPDTGAIVDVCHGPTPDGGCPRARRNGVVPCAGYLISPPEADPRLWPLPVPRDYRHCELGWSEQALRCLEKAETYRRRWRAGAARETGRVFERAAQRDPRFRKMTRLQLLDTGLRRWRLTGSAVQLARAEKRQRERARLYLSFAEFRRTTATAPLHGAPR